MRKTYKYTSLPVKKETYEELRQRKRTRKALEKKDLTWDEYLLDATK